jgi:peptidoglycan hydrolase FlgJ
VVGATTTEYHGGVPRKQVEKFRAYGSYAEAFSDYASLLRDNPRYAQVLQAGQATPDAAYALQRAGYATDPDYADKLIRVMRAINTLG